MVFSFGITENPCTVFIADRLFVLRVNSLRREVIDVGEGHFGSYSCRLRSLVQGCQRLRPQRRSSSTAGGNDRVIRVGLSFLTPLAMTTDWIVPCNMSHSSHVYPCRPNIHACALANRAETHSDRDCGSKPLHMCEHCCRT